MTNKYAPLDTRALNGVLGLVWVIWTVVKWFYLILGLLFVPVWVYFAWIEDPIFTVFVLLGILAVALVLHLTKRPRRRTKNA